MKHGLKERLFRGGIWAIGGKVASIFGAFVLNIVLARALTPTEYGAYFVAFNTVIILATVATIGADQVVIRYIAMHIVAHDSLGVKRVILNSLSIVLVGAVCVCAAFYFWGVWFFTDIVKAPAMVAFSGVILVWIFFATFQRHIAETFRGLKDIRYATLFGGIRNNGVIISLLSSFTAFFVYSIGLLNLELAYLIMGFSSFSVVALSISTLWRRINAMSSEIGESVENIENRRDIQALLCESWPLWLAAMLSALRLQGDGWLVAAYDSPENVALYGAAQRFVALVIAPLGIVNAILPPFIAELYARNEFTRLEKVVRGVATLAGVPACILILVLMALGPDLLGMIFGEYYKNGYMLLVILGIGQLINVLTGSCFIVLTMTGYKQSVMYITMLSALMLLVGGSVGGYLWGVHGVAIGSTVSTAIYNLIGMWAARRNVGIGTCVSLSTKPFAEVQAMLRKRLSAQ